MSLRNTRKPSWYVPGGRRARMPANGSRGRRTPVEDKVQFQSEHTGTHLAFAGFERRLAVAPAPEAQEPDAPPGVELPVYAGTSWGIPDMTCQVAGQNIGGVIVARKEIAGVEIRMILSARRPEGLRIKIVPDVRALLVGHEHDLHVQTSFYQIPISSLKRLADDIPVKDPLYCFQVSFILRT